MSKLAFILCVVLLASAANASWWSGKVEAAQKSVNSAIDVGINEIKTQLEAVKEKSFVVAEKLEVATLEFAEKLRDKISTILQKVQNEVDKITGKAKGVDVTECTKLAAHLHQTGIFVISEMSECVIVKLEMGSEYIQSILKTADKALENLTALKKEALNCDDKVDSIVTALSAIACSKTIGIKAAWITGKTIPAFSINTGELTYLLTTLEPSLTYCANTKGLLTFYRESTTIIDRTKRCITQKIDEFLDAEPEAHPTGIPDEYITRRTPIYFTKELEYTTTAQLSEETHNDDNLGHE